jgi:hypothetical protein
MFSEPMNFSRGGEVKQLTDVIDRLLRTASSDVTAYRRLLRVTTYLSPSRRTSYGSVNTLITWAGTYHPKETTTTMASNFMKL